MRITNHRNLPAPLVLALQNDPYTRGDADYSVSDLWDPPRKTILYSQHEADLEEDVSSRIYALLGSSVHHMIEQAARSGKLARITEERFFTEIDGVRISGKPDSVALIDDKLQDWKVTSVWSYVYGMRNNDKGWDKQLNTYRWLLQRQTPPIPIKELSVLCIFRDWSKLEAKRSPDYPQEQALEVSLPIYDNWEEQVRERIRLLEAAKTALPECTAEETWERPGAWAARKPGRDRAIKLFSSQEEADFWIPANSRPSEGLYVEHRPGQRIRCESYCAVASICDQYKKWKEANG